MVLWEEMSREDWETIKRNSNDTVNEYERYAKQLENRDDPIFMPTVLKALSDLHRRVKEIEDKIKEIEGVKS